MAAHGVVFRGIVPNDKLISELLISEFWLYPAIVNETFCTSILEAKAAGCIPIVRLQGGMQDVIGDGYFSIDNNDAIKNILNSLDLDKIREYNRIEALRYTWDARVLEWNKLLKI